MCSHPAGQLLAFFDPFYFCNPKMPLSKSDERRSRSSKGDERLSKMGGSLVFKMGGSWAQRASATEPETGLTSVQKMRAQVHMAENSGNARSYAIDPRTSRFVQWWDMAMLVALIFTALATPYECVYLSAHAYEAAVVATAVRGAAEEKPKAPQPGGASLEA